MSGERERGGGERTRLLLAVIALEDDVRRRRLACSPTIIGDDDADRYELEEEDGKERIEETLLMGRSWAKEMEMAMSFLTVRAHWGFFGQLALFITVPPADSPRHAPFASSTTGSGKSCNGVNSIWLKM
jgi:hypothetical protein